MLCQTTYSSSPNSSGANMQASIQNIVILMAMSHKNPMYMYMLSDSMHWNISCEILLMLIVFYVMVTGYL